MTPFWAFVLGILQDLLSGGPPGVWAASFLAAYFLIDRQRDILAGLSGIGAIAGFAVPAFAGVPDRLAHRRVLLTGTCRRWRRCWNSSR